jgi:hypothetical protein
LKACRRKQAKSSPPNAGVCRDVAQLDPPSVLASSLLNPRPVTAAGQRKEPVPIARVSRVDVDFQIEIVSAGESGMAGDVRSTRVNRARRTCAPGIAKLLCPREFNPRNERFGRAGHLEHGFREPCVLPRSVIVVTCTHASRFFHTAAHGAVVLTYPAYTIGYVLRDGGQR